MSINQSGDVRAIISLSLKTHLNASAFNKRKTSIRAFNKCHNKVSTGLGQFFEIYEEQNG